MEKNETELDLLEVKIGFLMILIGSFVLFPNPKARNKYCRTQLEKIQDEQLSAMFFCYLDLSKEELEKQRNELEKQTTELFKQRTELFKRRTELLKQKTRIAELQAIVAEERLVSFAARSVPLKKFFVQHWRKGDSRVFYVKDLTPGNELHFLLERIQRFWKDTKEHRLYGFRNAELSLSNRELIATNTTLLNWLEEYFTEGNPNNISFRTVPVENAEKPSPEDFPVTTTVNAKEDIVSEKSSKSVSSDVTRSSSRSYECRSNYKFICQFCGYQGERETTEAAHFYEKEQLDLIKAKDEDELIASFYTTLLKNEELRRCGICEFNDRNNAICLCKRCHDHFDKKRRTIGIHPETKTLVISSSIWEEPLLSNQATRYSTLQNKKVEFLELYEPPLELLKYRFKFYEDAENERLAHTDSGKKKRMKRKQQEIVPPDYENARKIRTMEPLIEASEMEILVNFQLTKEKCNKKTKAYQDAIRGSGFEVHPCKGDGNCFLHAVIDQLKEVKYPGKFNVQQLRERTQENLLRILNEFTFYKTVEYLNEANVPTVQEYVALMAQDGVYYSLPAMEALAIHLQIQIHVYTPSSFRENPHSFTVLNGSNGSPWVIRVLYTGGNHYDSLRSKRGNRRDTKEIDETKRV